MGRLVDEEKDREARDKWDPEHSPRMKARPHHFAVNAAQGSASDLARILREGVGIVAGDGSIDTDDSDPVHIAVVYNVTGMSGHTAAIYVDQNRYHASGDTALQAAFELLEEHELDAYPEHLAELEEEYGEDAMSVFTETFDGQTWTLSATEAAAALRGTKATDFVSIYSGDD